MSNNKILYTPFLLVQLTWSLSFAQVFEFPDFSDVEKNGKWDSTLTVNDLGRIRKVVYSNPDSTVTYEKSYCEDGTLGMQTKWRAYAPKGKIMLEWQKSYDDGNVVEKRTHSDSAATRTSYFPNGCISLQESESNVKGYWPKTKCTSSEEIDVDLQNPICYYSEQLKDTIYEYEFVLTGVWKSYFEDCSLEIVGEYCNFYSRCVWDTNDGSYAWTDASLKNGSWQFFDPDGRKYMEEQWKNGTLVNCIDF